MILLYILITAAMYVAIKYNTVDKSDRVVIVFTWLGITALTIEGLINPW